MSREVTQAPPFVKGRGQRGGNVDITTKKQKAVNNLTALFFVVDRGYALLFCLVLYCIYNQLNNTYL